MESPPNEEEAFPTTLKQIKGHFSTVHVVAYICCAIMSRQYSGWQHALFPGFGSFIIAQVLTSFGCICHYLCLMEIWSAVPFSGGNYALSRATLGFYLGFLDGVMEALVYITHSSISALSAGGRLCIIFDLKPDHATLFTFLLYLAAVCFAVQTNLYVLRRSFMIFGTLGLVILLIYCFGSLKWSNFMENASLHRAEPASHVDNWFQGGWVEWIKILPWTLQPYAGIRSFTLLTGMTKNPKTTLPRATLTAFSLIIAVHILVIFVFASEPGGIEYTSNQRLPSKTGWSLIFNMSDETNTKIANILSLPATFGRVFAYLIPGAMLLHSMGQSNLMPSILMVNHSKNHTTGVLISAILGMFIAVVNYYYGPIIEVFNLAVMGTMITDCTFLYGYILLKTTYSTVPREFVSPFGLFGAIFSIVMYVLIFISSAFYQNDYFALKFLAVLLGILTVYYFGFASRSQTLCEEEDQVFMKMHVRNYNKAKKTKQQRLKRNQNHAAAAVVPTGWRGVLHWLTRCCRVGGAARVADSGQGGSDSLDSGAVVPEPTCVTPPVMFSSSIIGTTSMPTINSSTVTGTTTTAIGATVEKYQLILDSGLVISESGKADLKEKAEDKEQTDGVELGVLSHSGRDELNKLPILAESVSVHSQKTAE